MPMYELCMIVRTMSRPELTDAMRRAGRMIFEHNGLLRAIENLGTRTLPYSMQGNYGKAREATTIVYQFYSAVDALPSMRETLKRDVDVLRARIHTTFAPVPFDCTLDNELQPAPYRKEVQDLIKDGIKPTPPPASKKDMQTGLDFYPFQTRS